MTVDWGSTAHFFFPKDEIKNASTKIRTGTMLNQDALAVCRRDPAVGRIRVS